MALRALDTHTHENLSNILGHFENVGFILIVVRNRVVKGTTVGTKQFLNPLIERNIACYTILKPVVIKQGRFVTNLVRAANL